MGLLTEAINEQAYLKAGFFGNAGSGKTTTASYLAIAISKQLGDGKPVAFFETEAGSDFMIERFKQEGITLLRKKSHALADLIAVAQEAEKACSVLIVDSISHVWAELCEAKLKAINAWRQKKGWNKIDKLEFQHWADVKREWAKWTTLFLNSSMHIIVCGRAGNTWEFQENEETGKKDLVKGGTKMKAEGEFGYEPSLLVEMVRVQKGSEPGQGWKHRAFILKDRTDSINGMAFDFERAKKGYQKGDFKITFKAFQPVIKALNIGGAQRTIDENASSEKLFVQEEGGSDYEFVKKQKDIALEEIEGLMVAFAPGQSKEEKMLKGQLIETLFNTRSWTEVTTRPLGELQLAVSNLRLIKEAIKQNIPGDLDEFISIVKAVCDPVVKREGQTTLEEDSLPQ